MAYFSVKYAIGDEVLAVLPADPQQINKSALVVLTTVECIEIRATGTVYILASGHHCVESELFSESYPTSFINGIMDTLHAEKPAESSLAD